MTFIRFKKFGKQEYAYQIQTLWNKQTQKPYQKSKYLGVVINKEKSIFERKNSFKSEKSILDFGDSYITRDCLEKTGFVSLIETVFGDKSKSLLALISYKLCYGSAMMYASKWLEGNFANLQYKDVNLSSQRISELFKYLGEESLQRIFFKKYLLDFVQAKNGIIIDVTSLPNQIHIPLSVWGLRGEEIDKQIRLLLVVDKETHYPLMFRILPGNIVDVSTLENTLEELKKYDIKINSICMDAGFFSENNIKEMYERNIPF